MTNAVQAELEKLRAAMTGLEVQRAVLGDAIVEPALAGLRLQIAALEAQPQADVAPADERRLITILFTDIVGSTALAEKLDPEDWRQTVAQLHATVGNLITQHQGTVAQYLGDGLLAFFGAQASSEQDAENAIRAALEFQNAIAHLDAPQKIQVRAGLHTGLVVVGELGADAHKEFTATGDAMNLAARLQSAAPPGGILISQDTYHYVRGVFDVTPQPPLSVKGKREPIQTYLVRRAKPRAFRTVTRGVTGVQTRTIGRDAEIAQLRDAYLDAYQNHRVVWAQLIAEPGVGKSRLVQDMDDWIELREETVRVFKARSFAGDQTQPFALIRRLWFDRFQIADDAPLAQAEAKWVKQFQELWDGADGEEPAHALGLLVGLPFAGSPHLGAMRNDPVQVKGRAFVVSRALFKRIRAQYPIEMLFEDLQWADAASWEYLSEVVWSAGAAENGLFVLATARPEWKPPEALRVIASEAKQSPSDEQIASLPPAGVTRTDAARYIQIDLAPLTDCATRELARELLEHVADVPADVVELIVNRAEGVPYFAEEIVNWFMDRGIIDRRAEPWRFAPARLKESPLPATLQHLLFTRLSALSDTERAALQRGAIFGRNFWSGGIEALGARHSAETLGHLQPRGFVEQQPESSFEGQGEWSFRQTLLREVAYESILKRERAALHKAAAEWLEAQARAAQRLDEFASLLAEHWERAGEINMAVDWYLRAGERAYARGALREAKTFFDRALEFLPPVERERRWRALLGRADVLYNLTELEAGQADAAALVTLAQEMDDDERRVEAFHRQALCANAASDLQTARQLLEAAVAAARRAGHSRLEARELGFFAAVQTRLGEMETARAAAAEALARARTLGDEATLASVASIVAVHFAESDDVARGSELFKEAAALAHRIGNRNLEADALSNLGYSYVLLGLYRQGRAMLEQALAVNEASGARGRRAYNLQNLGLAYFRTGDGHSARRVLDESIREFTVLGQTFGRAASLSYLALELEHSGDVAGAARRFREAADTFTEIGSPGLVQFARAGLARCALAQGQLDEARQAVTEVWNYLREYGASGIEFPVWAYQTCADGFDALGDAENAQPALDAGYRELMTRADKISNPEWRRSFLENVAEHRAIVEMWERFNSGQVL